MTDIVERLRARDTANPLRVSTGEEEPCPDALCLEAALVIERLRTGQVSVELLNSERRVADNLRAENDKLRGLVQNLVDEDPNELIADGGVTVLDQWRKDACRVLGLAKKPSGSWQKDLACLFNDLRECIANGLEACICRKMSAIDYALELTEVVGPGEVKCPKS